MTKRESFTSVVMIKFLSRVCSQPKEATHFFTYSNSTTVKFKPN